MLFEEKGIVKMSKEGPWYNNHEVEVSDTFTYKYTYTMPVSGNIIITDPGSVAVVDMGDEGKAYLVSGNSIEYNVKRRIQNNS